MEIKEILGGIAGGIITYLGLYFLLIRTEILQKLTALRLEIEEKYAHKTTMNVRFDNLDQKIDALTLRVNETNETLAKMCGKLNGNGGK